MRIRVLLLAAGVAVLAGLVAAAQQPKPAIPADVIPFTFRAFLVTDTRYPPIKEGEGKDAKQRPNPLNRVGKIHCLVCENGLAPVVAVFVRPEAKAFGAESGLAKLASGINGLIPKYRSDKLAVVRHVPEPGRREEGDQDSRRGGRNRDRAHGRSGIPRRRESRHLHRADPRISPTP